MPRIRLKLHFLIPLLIVVAIFTKCSFQLFIKCGSDSGVEDYYDVEEVGEEGKQQQQQQQGQFKKSTDATTTWLGFSLKLFGGYFNLTVHGNQVEPFGRCVASSQQFHLIEQSDSSASNRANERCYRCIFIDRRSTEMVTHMRTTSLQCLAGPNNAGADTLYRICAALSPSLPLLTLLNIDGSVKGSGSDCHFEHGYFNTQFESSCKSNNKNQPQVQSCIDNDGIQISTLPSWPVSSDGCHGNTEFVGDVSMKCLASWKAADQRQQSYAFVKVNSIAQPLSKSVSKFANIRCAMFHKQYRHGQSVGFVLALATGFDCSELSGVVLKSKQGGHLIGTALPNSVFRFTSSDDLITETTTSTTAMMPTSASAPHPSNSAAQPARVRNHCQLPNFVHQTNSWLSIDAVSYRVLISGPSSLSLLLAVSNERDKIAMHLRCVEEEISGNVNSKIYQGIFEVTNHRKRRSHPKQPVDTFKCERRHGAISTNKTKLQLAIEPSTSKRAQRQSSIERDHIFRCVTFYRRDDHVIELVLGSAFHGPTSSVCDPTIKEEHRVVLIDGRIFQGHASNTCLQHGKQMASLTSSVFGRVDAGDILGTKCLQKLCNEISYDIESWKSGKLLVVRKGASCKNSFFGAVQQCSYRWKKNYVADNLLLSPVGRSVPNHKVPLSCFVSFQNSIALTKKCQISCTFFSSCYNTTA